MAIEVSIIIPVYNEGKYIAKCLDSLLSQNFPHERLEILLVDGGSIDNTRNIINSYKQKHPFIRLLINPDRIVPKAMNIGIKAANGNVIIRMDAHTYYADDYVSKCVETLNTKDADNVGGTIKTLPGDESLVAEAISLATSNIFGVGNSKFRISSKAEYVDTVPFGAFRKEVFDRIGLYNENLVRNQDIELNSRIIKNGGKIYLNPEIKCYYHNRSNIKELWEQNFKNGMWNIYTTSISSDSLSSRHFIPLLFIASLLSSCLISCFMSFGKIILLGVVIPYFLLTIFFSAKIAINNQIRLMILLPNLFFILHTSYGFGSLWGILTIKKFKTKINRH